MVVGNGVEMYSTVLAVPVLVSAVAYTSAPLTAKPTAPTTAPTVCGPGNGAARRTESSGPAEGCWVPSQPRLSAQIDRGGMTTSAASTAIATLSVTRMPKSRRSGSADPMSTAKPQIVATADVKNARPVRLAACSAATSGSSPRCRSSRYRPRMSTENSAQVAITSGPLTVVSGLSRNSSSPTIIDETPTASSTGTSASSPLERLRVRNTRNSAARLNARYVRLARFADKFSSSPIPTVARPAGVALTGACPSARSTSRMLSGGRSSAAIRVLRSASSSRTRTARFSRLAGARRRLICVPVGSSGARSSAFWMSSGICSTDAVTSADVGAIGVAPSIMMIFPIVLTALDVETTAPSSRASASRVKSQTRSMTSWS